MPTMTTADMAMKMDPPNAISVSDLLKIEQFEAFAKAWFKLLHLIWS